MKGIMNVKFYLPMLTLFAAIAIFIPANESKAGWDVIQSGTLVNSITYELKEGTGSDYGNKILTIKGSGAIPDSPNPEYEWDDAKNDYATSEDGWNPDRDYDNILDATILYGTTSLSDELCLGSDSYYCKIIIDSGITKIGRYAFYELYHVTDVEISGSVTEIGYGNFSYCHDLKNVKLNSGLKTIKGNCFSNCEELTSVNLPAGIETIGEESKSNTLYECPNLKVLNVPASLKYCYCWAVSSYSGGLEKLVVEKYEDEDDYEGRRLPWSMDGTWPFGFNPAYKYYIHSQTPITYGVKIESQWVTHDGQNFEFIMSGERYKRQKTITNLDNGETLSLSSNDLFSKRDVLIIKSIASDMITVSDIPAYAYTGSAITPTVTVTDNEKVLTQGVDYTVSYKNNINAGTATATITGIGEYGGSREVTFTISKKNISPSVQMSGWIYGNTAGNPSVSGNSGSGTVTYQYKVSTAADSTYTSTKPTNAGTYTVKATIAATTNYNSGSCTKNFTISKANINPTVTMNGFAYGNIATNPSVTGNTGNGGVTYKYQAQGSSSWSTTKPTNVGTHKVQAIIAETTNYNGKTVESTYTVSKGNITPAVTMDGWIYGQTASNPSVTGNVDNGTISYNYTGTVNGGASYNSSTKPTNAGNYKVTATIAPTTNYNGATCEKSFTISRADITPSVSMDDFVYGTTASEPTVSGNTGNGLISYTYKADGGDSYSIVKPVSAGTHTVKATIGDTNNYNGNECTSTYTVDKADITPTISVADWVYGQTASTPVKSGNAGNGTETIEYKLTSADDSTYGTTVPTDAGDYTVRYTVAESANYNGGVVTNTFKIKKADITASVSMDDWTYGETASTPTTTCDIDDVTEVVEYKPTSSDEWTTTVPTNAGNYTVRYTVSKDNYNTKVVTDTFKILKADIDPEVAMADFTYSDTPSTPSVTGNTGNGNVTYTYKAEGGSSYETDVPINAGTHMVKAVIAETDNYKGATVTNTFKILKATKNITVSMDDFTYGQTATSPTVDGVGDHNGEVTYTYKAEGSNDFVSTKPVNAGTHTVKVTVSETDNFKSVSATSTYTVAKADINPTVSLEGWICGDTPKDPVVTGNSGNGEVSYLYKLATANNDAYVEEKPNTAGVYTVKAIIAESANYNGNEATSNFEIEPFVTIEKPSITINSTCKAVITAGDIDNDSVLRVEYRLNGGEWTTYTEPVVLYKAYEIEARQIARKSGKISEIEKVTGNEPVTEITAVYNGVDKYLNEAVEKSEITVTAHYPNSEDENVTNFSIDNYVVKREGNNTVTISALDKQTTITVKGKKHYVTIHGKLLFSDGSPVAGKEISLIQGTGSTLTTTTDDDGSYTFTNVEVGEYSITMESTVVRMAAAPLDLDAMAKANGDTLNDVNLTLDVNKTELEQLEDEELATAKEFLNDNNTLAEGTSCNLPQKTVIVVDGKPVTFAGGAFTFDKAGIYVITLPDNTEYTIIAVNEEEMENTKKALSEIDTPVAKDTEYDLPKGTKITRKGETTVVENGKFTFDASGIYDIVLPDGTSYKIVIIDEEEIEDAKEELSKVDRPVSKGDEMNLPAGTTITLDNKTFTFEGGVFSFSKPGIYVITLPDGTTYQIITIDEKAMAEVNERLSALEKNASSNESVTLPKGSKVEFDGKELDITDDDFTFDKEGTYIITLPDGTIYTIIVKEPVTEPTAKPETVTAGGSETLPDVSMISPEAARRPALTDDEKALLTKVKKVKPAVTKLASKKAGQIKVTMKGTKKRLTKQGIGYQIQVSGNKSFTKSKLYYSRDNKHGIKKLKSNKTYYIRVRLVKKDNKQIVGKWSKVRRIKVK